MSDDDWVKVEKWSDWGNYYYRIPGAWKSANKGAQKVLHAFDQIEIRWPDGTEAVVDVTTKSFSEKVYDHGRDYYVHNTLPVITADHHGIEVLVEFHQVEIRQRCLKGPGINGPK